MDKTLIEKLTELEASLKELEQDLSKVDISKDPQGYAEMAKRHSDLTQVVDLFNQWKTLNSDITDAQELLTEETDQNTKKEYELIISDSKAQVEDLTSKIKLALLPKDPKKPPYGWVIYTRCITAMQKEIHGKLKKLNLLILIWVDTAKLFLQLNQKEFTPN
jgi:protein subunit release factor A